MYSREVIELARELQRSCTVPMSDEEAIREAVKAIQESEVTDREMRRIMNLKMGVLSTGGSEKSGCGSVIEWFLAVIVFVVMMVAFALGGKLFGAW